MSGTSCLLFFPGTRPELLPKAIASGAGQVCADLEDAVATDAKAEARASVIELLADGAAVPQLVVRINHPATPDGEADVEALGRLGGHVRPGRPLEPLTIMVPKTDSRLELDTLRESLALTLGPVSLIPVVETARGLSRVEEIAAADGVSSIFLGGLDLSVELGCALEWDALLYARSRSVLAARLAGVEVIDTPFFDLRDEEGLRRETERVGRLGFTAKAAIHPLQVPVIHQALAPTDEDLGRARRVIAASAREGRGAFLLDGVMIDRPAVQAARRLLSRCGITED